MILSCVSLALAVIGAACDGENSVTEGSGRDAAAAVADGVIIATIVPLPTRTLEPPPAQPSAPTLEPATPTLKPATATPTAPPSSTPQPTAPATVTPSVLPSVTATPTPTAASTGTIALSTREQAIFDAHNAERGSRGVARLVLDATLQAIARERAVIMADNNLFSHYAPNGDTIFDMLSSAGYLWDDATENIHFNDVSLSQAEAWAMTEYLNSPAHRANILKPGFTRAGVGVATSAAGVHYYSVVFSD